MEIKARATGLTDVQQLIGAERFGSDALCDLLESNADIEEIRAVLISYLKVTLDMRETLEELSNTHTQKLEESSNPHARIGTEIVPEDINDDEPQGGPQGRWGVLIKVTGYTVWYSDAKDRYEATKDVEERLGKFADTRELLDNLKPGDTDWKVVAVDKAISRTNS